MGGANSFTPLTPTQLTAAETAQFKEIVKQALFEARVAIPGIIQDFDPEKQTVTVQVAVRELVRTNTGPQSLAIAPIYNVPIALPRGGGLAITVPIQQGDECLLVFTDTSFDLWWARGGVQDQFERRRHDITDCVAIIGCWNQTRLLDGYSPDSIQIRTEDGATIVEVTADGDINILAPSGTISIIGDDVIISPLSGGTF